MEGVAGAVSDCALIASLKETCWTGGLVTTCLTLVGFFALQAHGACPHKKQTSTLLRATALPD
jgi:hypothetical protein